MNKDTKVFTYINLCHCKHTHAPRYNVPLFGQLLINTNTSGYKCENQVLGQLSIRVTRIRWLNIKSNLF